ncbi:multidrug efflux RND transporter periplasmic adaptor subunit VexE [Paralimibaculum aggregatum]|uniref:Multidrug efflux RND transporter periplasmic adaptor subunit VexE n=1 Tax=Paralimibaculum aggregatum TaxID=3036245 RepID=A0ABQ6LP99_9RHOB|nr:efflux RND transporter periplasmic adaptor subunit [Limibaculum sp. NKW23]GMG82266.1 multidrug efflux RND transporter periplasmic adaptor subunit VexE [Limibaculum sp. NKW23]
MRWTSLLLSLAVVIGLAVYFAPRGEAPAPVVDGEAPAPTPAAAAEAAPEVAPVAVLVLTVTAEETADRLLVPGRTSAIRRVSIAAETDGLVVSEPRRRGARIAAGEVLCRIDPGSRQAQLAEALARREKARADAAAAESLSAKGFTAETTRIARQAELEAAQAAVDLIRLDIARLEIRAPFDGILETDTAELGARLGLGDVCATLTDLTRLRATGYVSEQVVDRITPGGPASVRLVNGAQAEGSVTYISRSADEDTRTYEVEITLDNADGRLRAGMTAELRIDLAPERAHKVPQSALTLDDDGRLGLRLAEETATGHHARFVPVSILRDEPDGLWVRGLPETARVIAVGQEFVRDGRPIRPSEITWDELG